MEYQVRTVGGTLVLQTSSREYAIEQAEMHAKNTGHNCTVERVEHVHSTWEGRQERDDKRG